MCNNKGCLSVLYWNCLLFATVRYVNTPHWWRKGRYGHSGSTAPPFYISLISYYSYNIIIREYLWWTPCMWDGVYSARYQGSPVIKLPTKTSAILFITDISILDINIIISHLTLKARQLEGSEINRNRDVIYERPGRQQWL